MMKKVFLLFSLVFIISCQKESSKPAIVNLPLKVKKEAPKKTALEYEVDENDKEIYNASSVDSRPGYPGGMYKFNIFLTKTYVTPKEAVENEAMGGIFTSMVIEKDGTLSDIKLLRDFGYGSGKELVRVLKLSPNWTPAIKDGKRVRCLYSFPFYAK
ncbi:TonB protein C-terminal [Flavobacterium sp. CF108]|uniref:energy transducer TonB n=1 Tax=unclassified Flavobacterium TaxID=196869 RepID=UPI0008B31D2B|nr:MULTISPECIES: energy transducer TonB [unclassified Flavobacterium]SEO19699.1 TonB protein C-terminal [Flavobacterium sp. fv08]SHG53438.1 TonB protein C-terminal [Flavobacterium sp. CF108]